MLTIITDLDGTLIGDNDSLEELNSFLSANRDKFFIIYSSGRNMSEFLNAMKYEKLIEPDAAILNTGADIYVFEKGEYIHDEAWHEIINKDWEPQKIDEIVLEQRWVTSQGKDEKLKLSYFVGAKEASETLYSVNKMISDAKIKAKVILSHEIYLDILPEKCDKGKSAQYLIEKQNINPGFVFVAGDSENDIELFEHFKNGVIVANAYEKLKTLGKNTGIYQSEDGYAAGVLEGLKKYMKENGM